MPKAEVLSRLTLSGTLLLASSARPQRFDDVWMAGGLLFLSRHLEEHLSREVLYDCDFVSLFTEIQLEVQFHDEETNIEKFSLERRTTL
jgi:hypothetical protein